MAKEEIRILETKQNSTDSVRVFLRLLKVRLLFDVGCFPLSRFAERWLGGCL